MRSLYLSVRKALDNRFVKSTRKFMRNLSLSGIEAAVILLISQVGFIFFCIKYFLSTPGSSPTSAEIQSLVFQNFGYGDLLGLLSGLFASSVVFFIINHNYFTNRQLQFLFYVGAPMFLLALVSPIKNGAESATLMNETFVLKYAATVTIVSFAFWVLCLWRQRTIADTVFDPNRGAKKMMEGVE